MALKVGRFASVVVSICLPHDGGLFVGVPTADAEHHGGADVSR